MTRHYLTDLVLAVALLVGTNIALLVPGVPWPVEWAFGIPFLLALPGYALVAALFPSRPEPASEAGPPGWVARAALSLALSAIVVALAGTALAALGTLWLARTLLLVGAVVAVAVPLAALRRLALPAAQRADPLYGVSPDAAFGSLRLSRPQRVVTAVAILALVGALVVAGGTPAAEDGYSEVYLSPENAESGTGTLIAAEENTVRLTIENHEGHATAYSTVLRLQRVGPDGAVRDQQRLDSFGTNLAAEETHTYDREVVPSMTGNRLRLQILVYKGENGGLLDGEPELTLRRWVDVEGGEA